MITSSDASFLRQLGTGGGSSAQSSSSKHITTTPKRRYHDFTNDENLHRDSNIRESSLSRSSLSSSSASAQHLPVTSSYAIDEGTAFLIAQINKQIAIMPFRENIVRSA